MDLNRRQYRYGAGPDGSFGSAVVRNLGVTGSNPGRPDICHGGCAYTALRTVQRPGVCSDAYGTVHYKEPLNSFGFPSVAILPQCAENDAKQYSLTHRYGKTT